MSKLDYTEVDNGELVINCTDCDCEFVLRGEKWFNDDYLVTTDTEGNYTLFDVFSWVNFVGLTEQQCNCADCDCVSYDDEYGKVYTYFTNYF